MSVDDFAELLHQLELIILCTTQSLNDPAERRGGLDDWAFHARRALDLLLPSAGRDDYGWDAAFALRLRAAASQTCRLIDEWASPAESRIWCSATLPAAATQ